jgi:DNA-binding XRE family transcriptional regulator
MRCPDCKDGKSSGFSMWSGYDASGKRIHGAGPREWICHRCDGTSHISDQQLAWEKNGAEIKSRRRLRGETQRKAAQRLSMRFSDYALMEQGKLDPAPAISAGL